MKLNKLRNIIKADRVCVFVGKRSVKEHNFPNRKGTKMSGLYEKYGDYEVLKMSSVPAGNLHVISVRLENQEEIEVLNK